jgi:uncharacterized protein YybS (DUF2232 family)
MLIIALIPIIVCIWIALGKKLSFYYSVLLSCFGCALSVAVILGSVYLVTGQDIVSATLDTTKQFLQQNEALTKSYYLMLQSMNGQAAGQVSMDQAMNTVYPLLETTIKYSIPTLYAAFIPLGGLAFYLLSRAIVKKVGGQVIRIPAFADFRLPPKFGRWSIAILLAALIGQAAGLRNFDYVFTIAFAFFGSVYYVLGMALMEWWLKKQIKQPAGRAAIIALIAILLFQLYIFIYIGIFEQLIKIRQRADIDKGKL